MTCRRTFPVVCAALLLTGLLTATGRAADDDTLRYKFKEGEKLHFVTEVKSTVEGGLLGDSAKVDITQMIDVTWEITKVDKDGRATVTSTLDRVRFSGTTPAGKHSYDTKDGDPKDKAFKP
jgi:hypothetical protein